MPYITYRFSYPSGRQDTVNVTAVDQEDAKAKYNEIDAQIAVCIDKNKALRIGRFPETIYCIGPEALKNAQFSVEYNEGALRP